MNYDSLNAAPQNEERKNDTQDEIVEKIIETYKKGFTDLLTKERKENDVSVVLVFNAPKYLKIKYGKFDKKEFDTKSSFCEGENLENPKKNTAEDKFAYDTLEFLLDKTEKSKDFNELKNYLDYKRNEAEKYFCHLKESFENFDDGFHGANGIFDKIKDQIKLLSSKYVANTYEEYKQKFERVQPLGEKIYFFEYEDFITAFCAIIQYYTQLNVKVEISYAKEQILIYFSSDEKTLQKLASNYDYYLQLAPDALHWTSEVKKGGKDDENAFFNSSEGNDLVENLITKKQTLQFEDYDINEAKYWPPYIKFEDKNESKYRKYKENEFSESLEEAFKAFSTDNSNELSKEQLITILTDNGPKLSKENAEELVNSVLGLEDKINFLEFYSAF